MDNQNNKLTERVVQATVQEYDRRESTKSWHEVIHHQTHDDHILEPLPEPLDLSLPPRIPSPSFISAVDENEPPVAGPSDDDRREFNELQLDPNRWAHGDHNVPELQEALDLYPSADHHHHREPTVEGGGKK